MLAMLPAKLGFSIKGEAINLGDCRVNVDGINRDNRFICEVYAHVGALVGSQPRKVSEDILKLNLIETRLGGKWRKAICFACDLAAKGFMKNSWRAIAVKEFGVEIIVLNLSDEEREVLAAAQRRQYR